MSVEIHPNSPPFVMGNGSTGSLSTAPFNAPPNSLIIVGVATGAAVSGQNAQISISDNFSSVWVDEKNSGASTASLHLYSTYVTATKTDMVVTATFINAADSPDNAVLSVSILTGASSDTSLGDSIALSSNSTIIAPKFYDSLYIGILHSATSGTGYTPNAITTSLGTTPTGGSYSAMAFRSKTVTEALAYDTIGATSTLLDPAMAVIEIPPEDTSSRVSIVGYDAFSTSTNTSTGSITVPATIQDDDWLFVFAGAAGTTAGTPASTDTGSIGGGLTQIGTTKSMTGHTTSAWMRKLVAADAGKTVTIVMQAATAKPVLMAVAVRGLDPVNPLNDYAADLFPSDSDTIDPPTVTTTRPYCAELSVVFMSGSNSDFDNWGPTYPVKYISSTDSFGASNDAMSVAFGATISRKYSGVTLGGLSWLSDPFVGASSAWTLALQPQTSSTVGWIIG